MAKARLREMRTISKGLLGKKNKFISVIIRVATNVHSIGILSIIACISICGYKEFVLNKSGVSVCEFLELLNGIAISVFAAYVFFLFQLFFSDYKRKKMVYPIILRRIETIINNIDKAISELGNIYLDSHQGNDYTEAELHRMLNLSFDDETSFTDVAYALSPNPKKIVMRDWLLTCANKVEFEIDRLYRHYGTDIPIELNDILERIIESKYHTMLVEYAKWRVPMRFSECNIEIIAEYWHLRNELQEFKKKL